jgi:hypothetical protein
MPDPLAPTRQALVERAAVQAARTRADAAARAQEAWSRARADAVDVLRRAESAGTADATADAARMRAAAQRTAHERVLITLHTEEAHLVTAVDDAVRRMDGRQLAGISATLVRYARWRLGPDARVEELDDGGVRASMDRRQLDLSLVDLAHRAMDRVLDEAAPS